MVMGNRRHTLSLHILEEDSPSASLFNQYASHTMKTDNQSVTNHIELFRNT